MKNTPPPAKKDYEAANLARARLDQTGVPPRRDELKSIDRILVEQARQRLKKNEKPRA